MPGNIVKTGFFRSENHEILNVVCSNSFKNFILSGKKRELEILNLIKKYSSSLEFSILFLFYKLQKGNLLNRIYTELIESNTFIKNIIYFVLSLKKLQWSELKKFFLKIKEDIIDTQKNYNFFILLNNIVSIIKIKNIFDLYCKGLISEDHFIIAISNFKLNSKICHLFKKVNLFDYILKFKSNLHLSNISSCFKDLTLGFYDAIIARYKNFSIYSTSNRSLGIFMRKRYHLYLRKQKKKNKKSYAVRLAYKYLGKRFKLPYSKKWKNLRYRAYRIFLYTFKIKPKKLWQITRKSRKGKNLELLDHIAYFELTLKNLMLLSNFNLNLQEFAEYLKDKLICVDGRIILNTNFVIKPYAIIHFVKKIVNSERSRFLLNLLSSFEKGIFVKDFNTLFEYNFTSYCFTMLPGFLDHKFINLSPYYTNTDSGRFSIQKV